MSGQRGRALLRIGLVATALVALGFFAVWFDQGRWQPRVDVLWVLAVVCWMTALWRREIAASPRLRHPYWLYVLYLALFLPFYDNWRWAMTGDSMMWPKLGIELVENGPSKSLLSIHGNGQFGYTQLVVHNLFMKLFSPTLFWHRVGSIVTGLLSLIAVYVVFARLVSERFGLLVTACAASTSITIVHTLCSYPLLDAIACGYGVAAAGLWVRREPESRRAWLVLGFLTGLMLFFTPNSWFMGFCVWAWLGIVALRERWRWSLLAIAGATAVIVGLPMIIQLLHGEGREMFTQVDRPAFTVGKVLRFMSQAALMPVYSQVHGAGAFGPQLPLGFRWLFVVGILLAPLAGRRFPGARLMLAFFLVHVVIIAFTQGSYIDVSVKRTLVLIPMATYFVFILFHERLRSLALIVVIVAVWASFGVYDLSARMMPGRTGYTLLDGVIEAHQRFARDPVCVFVKPDQFAGVFLPGSIANRLYRLSPHIHRVTDPADPACARVLCYSPQIDPVDFRALGYTEVTLQNSWELRCGEKG